MGGDVKVGKKGNCSGRAGGTGRRLWWMVL